MGKSGVPNRSTAPHERFYEAIKQKPGLPPVPRAPSASGFSVEE